MTDIPQGYIPSVRTPSDYIKGKNSPLIGAAFPNFDWRTVRPVLDLQNKNGFETWGCVSWAAVQDCEDLFNAQLQTLPQTHLNFLTEHGYFINGKIVFSKAFIWIQSGTVEGKGNSFPNVANAIHQFGLIPETVLPFNPAPGATWGQLFIEPTAEQLALGQLFKQYFDVGYHYLQDTNFAAHLQDGPIQIAIPTCPGYNTADPIPACSLQESHSVLMDFIEPNNQKEIVDHYSPEIKTLSADYPIPDSMQYVITPKSLTQNNMQLIRDNGTIFLVSTDKTSKIGIGNADVLTGFFPTELITDGDTSHIPQIGTLADGVILHK